MDIIEQLIQRVSSHKPATIKEVAAAEDLLGFSLPTIVRRIYLEVGNGGFGPCKGIFDIAALTDEYLSSLQSREHNQREWPQRLLPICHWGCNIYSCLDCTSSDVPVIRVDYNLDIPWMKKTYALSTEFKFFQPYSNDAVAAWIEATTVEEWFSDWLSGVDQFSSAYPPRRPKSEWH